MVQHCENNLPIGINNSILSKFNLRFAASVVGQNQYYTKWCLVPPIKIKRKPERFKLFPSNLILKVKSKVKHIS